MGEAEIRSFMSYLVNERNVAGATYTQALCALIFLYKNVLGKDLPWIEGINRPKRVTRQPTVLTVQELERLFAQMDGVYGLIARLLYGTGMRLMECAQLRIKDIDFQRREITIREGKGKKDRLTMLPLSLVPALRSQINQAHQLYNEDRLYKRNGVMVPNGIERKYPSAGTQ